jgi:hypothetical protein
MLPLTITCWQNIWVAVTWRNIPQNSNGVISGDRSININKSLNTDKVLYILVGFCREYTKAIKDLSIRERFNCPLTNYYNEL